MTKKTIKLLSIVSIVSIIFIVGCSYTVSTSNNEIDIRNTFTQKSSERTTYYDGMWKTLSGKSQVALKNDSSFRENVNIIMSGRKDAEGVVFKWITESNPNANFGEVAALYKDLSRAIESQREGFKDIEKTLQDVKKQHDNMVKKFPSNIVLGILGRKQITYIPITSDRIDEVIITGKDNNVKVFQ